MFKLIRFLFKLSALAGVVMMIGAVITKITRPSRGGPDSDDIDLVSIWSGTDIESNSQSFRGGSILSWWGGTNLDLRQAKLDHDWGYISIRSIFGGTSITVPEDWRVEVRGSSFAGGVDGPSNDGLPADAPLLDIDAFALFGGVSITRKSPDEM